jgi:hypothetical protein
MSVRKGIALGAVNVGAISALVAIDNGAGWRTDLLFIGVGLVVGGLPGLIAGGLIGALAEATATWNRLLRVVLLTTPAASVVVGFFWWIDGIDWIARASIPTAIAAVLLEWWTRRERLPTSIPVAIARSPLPELRA